MKEDLIAIGFKVTMLKHYRLTEFSDIEIADDSKNAELLARFRKNEALFESYFEGVNIIRVAVQKGLYLETDIDFCNILQEILGPLLQITWETYCTILTDRDVTLARPIKPYKYLMDLIIAT